MNTPLSKNIYFQCTQAMDTKVSTTVEPPIQSSLQEISRNQEVIHQKSAELNRLMRAKISECSRLKEQLEKATSAVKTLEERIEGVNMDIVKEREDKALAIKERESVKKELSELKEEHAKALNQLEDLREQEQHTQQAEDKEKELEDIAEKLRVAEERHEQFQLDTEVMQKNIQELEVSLAEMKAELANKIEACEKYTTENSKLREELEAAKAIHQTLEEKDEEIRNIKAERDALEARLSAVTKEHDPVTKGLKQEVDALKREREEQGEQITTANEKVEALKTEVHNQKTRIAMDKQANLIMLQSHQKELEKLSQKSSNKAVVDEKLKARYESELKKLEEGSRDLQHLKDKTRAEYVLAKEKNIELEKRLRQPKVQTPEPVIQIVKELDYDANYYKQKYESLLSNMNLYLERGVEMRVREQR